MPNDDNRAVERLTALWALSEAGLGGFLHALKSPLVGTVTGAAAVMIICLIAHYADRKISAILKALTIVLIIKVAVSPHSPVTAYFAVSFQALAGAALFCIIPRFRVAAFLLGVLSLLESALQKILILTLMYGNSLWESINVLFAYLSRHLGFGAPPPGLQPSALLIALYLGFYGVIGGVAGFLGGVLPRTIAEAMSRPSPPTPLAAEAAVAPAAKGRPRRPRVIRKLCRVGLVVTTMVVILTFFTPAVSGAAGGVPVVLHTAGVLLVWYFLAGPLLLRGLRRFLKHKEDGYSHDIRNALALFTHLKAYAGQWRGDADGHRGLARVWQFLIAMVVFALTFEATNPSRGSAPGETR